MRGRRAEEHPFVASDRSVRSTARSPERSVLVTTSKALVTASKALVSGLSMFVSKSLP